MTFVYLIRFLLFFFFVFISRNNFNLLDIFQMFIRTIYLILIFSTAISSNRFYDRFRQLKTNVKEKLHEKCKLNLRVFFFSFSFILIINR